MPAATVTDRRTPGLRREEVAELAHISVDYCTRMEQAWGPRPSARILNELGTEVDALKVRRWLLGMVGAMAGVVGAATGAIALFR